MKQTAVEWLVEQLKKQKNILQNHFELGKWNDDRCSEIDNCILICEQAKEMEKEQIVNSHIFAHLHYGGGMIMPSEKEFEEFAQQYYNETYGNR